MMFLSGVAVGGGAGAPHPPHTDGHTSSAAPLAGPGAPASSRPDVDDVWTLPCWALDQDSCPHQAGSECSIADDTPCVSVSGLDVLGTLLVTPVGVVSGPPEVGGRPQSVAVESPPPLT